MSPCKRSKLTPISRSVSTPAFLSHMAPNAARNTATSRRATNVPHPQRIHATFPPERGVLGDPAPRFEDEPLLVPGLDNAA